ncbi:MAG: hypothetical protein AABX05_03380 [Nanoarchaeota archaeon]
METTTIKVYSTTKNALDDVRQGQETYDKVISRLISQNKKKNLVKELVEAYQSKAKDDIKIAKEWDAVSDVD